MLAVVPLAAASLPAAPQAPNLTVPDPRSLVVDPAQRAAAQPHNAGEPAAQQPTPPSDAPAAPAQDKPVAGASSAEPAPAATTPQPTTALSSGAATDAVATLTGAPSSAELEALIRTLDDPDARSDFIGKLKTLQAAGAGRSAAKSAPTEIVAALSDAVDNRLNAVIATGKAVGLSLTQLPDLVDWLRFQITNDFRRRFWATVLQGVGLVLGAGIASAWLLQLFVRRLVRRLRPSPDARLGRRILVRTAAFLLDIFPLAGLAIATGLIFRIEPLATITVTVGTYAVLAVALYGAVFKLSRHAFDAVDPARRWLPLADKDAYLVGRSIRRIAATAIFGYFGLRATIRLGLPPSLSIVLAHIVFISTALLITVFVLRARASVENYVRQGAAASQRSALLRAVVPWELLASSGYVLVLLLVWAHYFVWAVDVEGGFTYLLLATSASILILGLGQLLTLALDRIAAPGRPDPATGEESGLSVDASASGSRSILFPLAHLAIRLAALIAILQAWGIDVVGWLHTPKGRIFATHATRIGMILGVTLIVWLVLNRWIAGYMTARDAAGNLLHSNRSRTLANIGRNVLLVAIALLTGATVLSEIGVDTAPLLAGAGVVGLAVGFGSQTLVKDIITGMFILLGDTIRVGDVVNVGGKGGLVEGMSMRSISLRDYNGSVHTVPYGSVDVVTNMTKDFSYWVFRIGVAYRESVDEVMAVLRSIDEQIRKEWPYRRIILEPLEIAGVDAFADSAVIILARVKTRPIDQWRVGREMQRRIKLEFDRRGIEMPYPHQTLYFGRDKEGSAPPLLVEQLLRETQAGQESGPRIKKHLASAG